MKKITAILLAAVFAAALCACTPVQPRATAAEPVPFETSRPARTEEYNENGAGISLSVYDSWRCEPYNDGSENWNFISISAGGKSYTVTWSYGGDTVPGDALREAGSELRSMLSTLSLS